MRLAPGATRDVLVARDPGSPLGIERIALDAGARAALPEPGDDELLGFVVRGGGRGPQELRAGDAVLWRDEERDTTLEAGEHGMELLLARAGRGCDEHAPLGQRAGSSHLDLDGGGERATGERATGERSFQVLLGPENGCCRATMFVGVVPPGAAPWHFHQYDEIIVILDGGGAYHQASGSMATGAGTAVRIPPRTVHINENGGDGPMLLLGVFTPAGSPSAAYLAADPR